MPPIDLAKGTKVPTLKVAKTILSSWNMTIVRKTGDYRVAYKRDTLGVPVDGTFYEDTAYYTDDLTDAVCTGIQMRAQHIRHLLSIRATKGSNQ